MLKLFLFNIILTFFLSNSFQSPTSTAVDIPVATSTPVTEEATHLEKYEGPVKHVFFHSLIIYPDIAARSIDSKGYEMYMINVSEFEHVIDSLYKNGFVLIDPRSMYSVGDDGKIKQKDIYVPVGKKPLIISQDDVGYYSKMDNSGFASKLVFSNGRVLTEVKTPEGTTTLSDKGDVVPILDSFVMEHPDFAPTGFKGVLALTGFEGILGYRTEASAKNSESEREKVAPVVAALKADGWAFANHSYWHDSRYLSGSISEESLRSDIKRWKSEVESLVGPTDLYVGPFGEVFKPEDPRRKILVESGYKEIFGVGIDGYTHFFDDYMLMNRTDIDGYRLKNNSRFLKDTYGI